MNKQVTDHIDTNKAEAGFSLIEAICATAILTIGLVTTAYAISSALKFNQINKNVTEAKNILLAQIEDIQSLRDSGRLRFNQIVNNNTNSPVPAPPGSVPFTGFPGALAGAPAPNDFYPVSTVPGADGVYGTIDDVGEGAPGPFKQGFSKSILIRNLDDNLKQITVIVKYPGPNDQMYEFECSSFLNNDIRR